MTAFVIIFALELMMMRGSRAPLFYIITSYKKTQV